MFKMFDNLILLKNILSRLVSLDASQKRLVEIAELNFKLECIKANVDPQAVKEAFIDTGSEGEGLVLQQTDKDLAEIEKVMVKFKEIMGREPVSEDSMAYIKHKASQEPD